MRYDRYLITTSVGNRSWQVIWEGKGELALEHGSHWRLRLDDHNQPTLRRRISPTRFEDWDGKLSGDLDKGAVLKLHSTTKSGGRRKVMIKVRRVGPPVPSYAPVLLRNNRISASFGTSERFVYWGVHNFLLGTRKIRTRFAQRQFGKPAFVFACIESEYYKFKAYVADLVIEFEGNKLYRCPPGETLIFRPSEFEKATIRYGVAWWRVNVVKTPPVQTGLLYEIKDLPENLWLKRATRVIAALIISAGIFIHFGKSSLLHIKKPSSPPQVTWRQPKLLPVEPLKQVPIPPPAPKPPPRQSRLAKSQNRPTPKPAHKKLSTTSPKSSVAQQPTVTAQQELARSLDFLSAPKAEIPSTPIVSPKAHYASTIKAIDLPNSSALRKADPTRDAVDLRGARDIATDVGIKERQNSKVRGRLALNAVYDPNALSGAESTPGSTSSFSTSGPGTISNKAVLAALSKSLGKFQYCYEKALIRDPSLAGIMMMQWTITSSGKATDIKVVKSQLSSGEMQTCLATQLEQVVFAKPTGGSVEIRYPFEFSSSSL